MTGTGSLEGPRAKLRRADEHRHDLHDAIEAYVALDPLKVTRPQLNEEGSMFEMYGFVDPEPPIELGLMLGDYVNNLRAALDHLVWQLVLLADGTPGSAHKFPITDEESDFGSKKHKWLAGIPEPQVEAIASLQPSNHPDGPAHHMLGLLRWLSNTDKHRVIHTMATSAVDGDPDSAGFRLIKGSGQLDKAQIRPGALLADGEPVLRARLDPPDPNAEAEWYGQFDARPVFGDRRVTDAGIHQLQGVVTTIVEHFAPDFGEQH